MMRIWKLTTGAILTAVLSTAPILAAEKHEEQVKKDLFSVIALHGRPCGKVTAFQRRGEDDYIATCQNGSRYRVYVVSGRVNVERQD